MTTRTEAQQQRRPSALALVHGSSCICHICGNQRTGVAVRSSVRPRISSRRRAAR